MRSYPRTRGERRGPKSPWQRPAAPSPAPQTQPRQLEQLLERVAAGEIADITPAEWVLIERARKREKFAPLIEAAKREFETALATTPGDRRGRPKKSTTTGAARARRQP